jgi:hypothetical protein
MCSGARTRAVALLMIGIFGFHIGRSYLIADLANFTCPHHVPSAATNGSDAPDAPQHAGHNMPGGLMPVSHGASPEGQPSGGNSGIRCCCRHTLDGLITTLILDVPADAANVPFSDAAAKASSATVLSVSQADLNPPLEPPRV